MPEAPVADQVDQHVVAELLAEGEREAHRADAGRDVVGVDVDDRHVEALRQVGAQRVERASSGSVVKPIWLLVMRCTVPPTL